LLTPLDGLAGDHSAYYHRLILSRLPPESQRVLDASWGARELTGRLARRVPYVVAVDRDAATVELARRAVAPGVAFRQADLLCDPLPNAGYDAVVFLGHPDWRWTASSWASCSIAQPSWRSGSRL
jgi:ubiquinone/menaquinone biosynthesis C-methylase UbiE